MRYTKLLLQNSVVDMSNWIYDYSKLQWRCVEFTIHISFHDMSKGVVRWSSETY